MKLLAKDNAVKTITENKSTATFHKRHLVNNQR